MSQAVGLFGLKLKPGEVHRVSMVFNEFKITNVSFGESVTGNKRAVIKVHHIPHYGHPAVADEDEEDEEDDEDDEDDEEAQDAKDLARAEKAYTERTFVLCTLTPGKIEQASVDIAFSEDEDIGFSVTGDNEVDLLGNYTSPVGINEPPYSDEEMSDEEDDSDDYDSDGMPINYPGEYDEDDEEIDSDEYDSDDFDADGLEAILAEEDSGLEDEDEDDEDEDEDDDEEESDESRIEEVADVPVEMTKSAKKRKAAAEAEEDEDVSMTAAAVTDAELEGAAAAEGIDVSKLSKSQRKRLNKKLKAAGDAGDVSAVSAASASSAKPATSTKESKKATIVENGKAKTAAKETTAENGKTTSSKTKLPNGVVVEVKKTGSGPAAKKGQKIGMRYIGKLAKNGKVFDQNTKGKPFTFKLGRGEVIKAWDEGIVGMQAGEERRLTCPPATAYGSRGAPPDIPGNSVLVFDVKCITIG